MGTSKINMNTLEKQSASNAKHIAVLNSEMGETRDHVKIVASEVSNLREDVSEIRTEVSSMKSDLDWLKRFFWIVASSSVGSLGVGMINLLR